MVFNRSDKGDLRRQHLRRREKALASCPSLRNGLLNPDAGAAFVTVKGEPPLPKQKRDLYTAPFHGPIGRVSS
jgi:hypothetical protein